MVFASKRGRAHDLISWVDIPPRVLLIFGGCWILAEGRLVGSSFWRWSSFEKRSMHWKAFQGWVMEWLCNTLSNLVTTHIPLVSYNAVFGLVVVLSLTFISVCIIGYIILNSLYIIFLHILYLSSLMNFCLSIGILTMIILFSSFCSVPSLILFVLF